MELRQMLIALIFPALILAGLGAVFVLFYQGIWITILTLCVYFLMTAAISLLITKGIWKDYYSGKKKVFNGTVMDKKLITNYGWHGNIGADLASQPKLLEYYLYVDEKPYHVHKEKFDSVEIGDDVRLSFSVFRDKLLGVS